MLVEVNPSIAPAAPPPAPPVVPSIAPPVVLVVLANCLISLPCWVVCAPGSSSQSDPDYRKIKKRMTSVTKSLTTLLKLLIEFSSKLQNQPSQRDSLHFAASKTVADAELQVRGGEGGL